MYSTLKTTRKINTRMQENGWDGDTSVPEQAMLSWLKLVVKFPEIS